MSEMRHRSFVFFVLLAALVLSMPISGGAQDRAPGTGEHVWIIGGGPTPAGSGAQIEFNVKWVLESLREMIPGAQLRVYFANGRGPEPSVHETRTAEEYPGEDLEGLSRIFGAQGPNRYVYRPHEVPDVLGSTRADALALELAAQFRELNEGDRAFIIYNGHGSWYPDPADNGLRLWGESHLSAREFERLLSEVHRRVPVRFLFTQCYAGGFERVVHPDAQDVKELAKGTRCGFFAESEDRESEGCSASIEVGDYRDYTTFFFAALKGENRLGEPVEGIRDFDKDGTVTPFEAHLFSLAEGYNGDLPRSTSEVFLERWEPWYLRWFDTGALPNNVYGDLARNLARKLGFPEDGGALARRIEDRHRELKESVATLEKEKRHRGGEIRRLQETIQRQISLRWPAMAHPHTVGYRTFLLEEVWEAEEAIRKHASYADLVAGQNRLAEIELELMDLDRAIAQLEKLRRIRSLARLMNRFERFASQEDRARFQQLRSCEELPLIPPGRRTNSSTYGR